MVSLAIVPCFQSEVVRPTCRRRESASSPLAVRFEPATSARESNRGHLRFARARPYIPGMDDIQYWTKVLKDAERALDAATTRSALNAAAKRLMLAQAARSRRPGSPVALTGADG